MVRIQSTQGGDAALVRTSVALLSLKDHMTGREGNTLYESSSCTEHPYESSSCTEPSCVELQGTLFRRYYSPYPDDYASEITLYICEYCLKYMRKLKTLQAHLLKCMTHRPPGEEIYHAEYPIWSRTGRSEEEGSRRERNQSPVIKSMATLSMYEVDGVKNKVYCQVSKLAWWFCSLLNVELLSEPLSGLLFS